MAKVVASARQEEDSTPFLQPQLHITTSSETKKKVLFMTSEMADLVKVGGLGDVSASLPRALACYHDIRLLIPGYRQVMESGHPVKVVGTVYSHSALPHCKLGRIDLPDGLIVYVIICPALYERDGYPYGDNAGQDWPDNHIRFAMLGHVAAEIAAQRSSISWTPQLIHANDWPCGLVPAYLSWRGLETPTVFTIHNARYQGLFSPATVRQLGFPLHDFDLSRVALGGDVSFLKAGVCYGSHITTVSRRYAQDLTASFEGHGLESVLGEKAAKGQLSGILNGIDSSWDPLTDHCLEQGFQHSMAAGKAANRRHVRQHFGLFEEGPLFAVVSRLVHQKGIDLTVEAAGHIVAAGGSLVIFGQGEPALEAAVRSLQECYPGRVAAQVGFNDADARRIFAGSDFLLMPSRFEPCGLSQLYAQRYACLPVARCTGGLADTIEDGINGFLFDHLSLTSYLTAIQRALATYCQPGLFQTMRQKAMTSPCYWQQSVQPYEHLYRQLTGGCTASAISA